MKTASAALAAATAVAFLPVLGAGFVNFDDGVNFLRNPHYRGFSAENLAWMFSDVKGHYMPVTWLTLAFDYVLWGMDARGYHFTSLAFHAANAVLFFRILEILLRRAGVEAAPSLRAAAAGALLYAVHPLRVESVAWVTERRDVVCGLFFLLSILWYLKALDDPLQKRRRLAWSLAFFALSLLSKTMSMGLPFVLVILDAWPLRRWNRDALREKVPYFALFVAAVVVTYATQIAAGAMVKGGGYAAVDRLTQPGYRIFFYVWKTLLPLGLQPAYLWPEDPAPWRPWAAAGVALGLGLTAALWALRRRWPAPIAAWLAFGFLLAPVAGFFQAGPHFAADRYTYFAGFAAAALGAAAVARGLPLWIAGALIAVLGGLTFRQSGFWISSEALWNHALAVEPDNALARNNRGLLRSDAGDLEGALADFDACIRSSPRQPRGYAGRGRILLMKRDGPGALAALDQALRVDPGFAFAWESRGAAKILLRDFDGARADLDEALRLAPDSSSALSNRAAIRLHKGDVAGAIEDLRRAAAVDPADLETALRLGEALEAGGRRGEAVDAYRRASGSPDPRLKAEAAKALQRILR